MEDQSSSSPSRPEGNAGDTRDPSGRAQGAALSPGNAPSPARTGSELKKILRHALVYGAGNILGKIVGFVMIPVYTRYLTPSDYGVIELLDLTVFILGTLIGYSMTSALVRYYYQYREQSERDSLVCTGLLSSPRSPARPPSRWSPFPICSRG